MNLITTKIILISLCCLITGTLSSDNDDQEWENFKETYEKSYSSNEEEVKRKAIFLENLAEIQEHNKKYAEGEYTYEMGVNEYSDMTDDEFTKMSGVLPDDELGRADFAQNISFRAKIPDSMSWYSKGFRNPIRHQGGCGSCYAFSSSGAIEGQYFRKYGKLVVISPQEIIDCTKGRGNYGCKGGYLRHVFSYAKNYGVSLNHKYPYAGKEQKCVVKPSPVKITDYYELKRGDENTLKRVVATVGPVPVDIDASLNSFKYYKSGVYYDAKCSQTKLTHSVLIIGYGTNKKGQDYWLVKNSWGSKWGGNGYIYMARNKNNNCGIASRVVYPYIA